MFYYQVDNSGNLTKQTAIDTVAKIPKNKIVLISFWQTDGNKHKLVDCWYSNQENCYW